MKKIISFFWLCFPYFLFSGLVLAEMSGDDEKRTFIESLAEPLTEKTVFFRWDYKEFAEKLIKVGEVTPDLYEHFTNNRGYAGSGIYVSMDIFSSSNFGETLIQVEVPPGYKFLHSYDNEVIKKLKEKGIDFFSFDPFMSSEVYTLNPRIMLSDKSSYGWFILKEPKDVKFKPFSPHELSLDVLYFSYASGIGEPSHFNRWMTQSKRDFFNRTY